MTGCSSATEVRTEDGSNKQLDTPGQVLVSVVTSTSGHSTLSATAPVGEGTTAGNGGKRKKKMMKLLKIFIILSSMGWGFGPWNNGKEVPRLGVAEIQKMSPSTTGRCYCCH